MRFKLDENLDPRLAELFADGGHEAESARAEGLGGKSDEEVFRACAAEKRVLVTLDLDFADPVRFPPQASAGIVVLRPQRNTLTLIRAALESALPALKDASVEGALWIVEPGRIRAHEPDRETPET